MSDWTGLGHTRHTSAGGEHLQICKNVTECQSIHMQVNLPSIKDLAVLPTATSELLNLSLTMMVPAADISV